MDIYGISDLHLPGGEDKPMDIFGPEWHDHAHRIASAWREMVAPEDVVLLPGDLSWAMRLSSAQQDLDFLGELPGQIVLVKGNHDLWWKSISQLRQRLPSNVYAIQNDFFPLPKGLAICGTRGWKCPTASDFTTEDERVYRRELERLRLSVGSATKAGYQPDIAMLHYPPTDESHSVSAFMEILETAGVRHCIYGHLHGYAQKQALIGLHRGVHYHLVACDATDFKPLYITSLT
ncbi:MAG: phosphohydrolase [Firmicutes bacterium]|nr:phosphohydrolase [Bacillota bacterium]